VLLREKRYLARVADNPWSGANLLTKALEKITKREKEAGGKIAVVMTMMICADHHQAGIR
jgi:hypothetical protein